MRLFWNAYTTTPAPGSSISSNSKDWLHAPPIGPASSPRSRSILPATPRTSPVRPLLDEDFLILSTIHSAKGLEWDSVYVIHAADGNIPSDMATGRLEEIEEERRLFYVALTRAKDWLYVCYPLRYYSYPRTFSDVHGYAQLTRFLPESVRRLFEETQASSPTSADETSAATSLPAPGMEQAVTTEDIRRRLKGLF